MKSFASLTFLGILFIILGTISIVAPTFAGSAVMIIIGTSLLIVGFALVVHGLKADSQIKRTFPVFLGIITALVGTLLIIHPLFGLSFLTLLMIFFFITGGFWKIISSFSYRSASGWLAMFFGGVLSLVLGLLIWQQWPISGLWAVGVFIGVDLLMTGIAMIVLASSLQKVAKARAA